VIKLRSKISSLYKFASKLKAMSSRCPSPCRHIKNLEIFQAANKEFLLAIVLAPHHNLGQRIRDTDTYSMKKFRKIFTIVFFQAVVYCTYIKQLWLESDTNRKVSRWNKFKSLATSILRLAQNNTETVNSALGFDLMHPMSAIMTGPASGLSLTFLYNTA